MLSHGALLHPRQGYSTFGIIGKVGGVYLVYPEIEAS